MVKMHENELEVDEVLVSSLLKNQCPQWANLSLKAVKSSGTDNALFRLGGEYIVRLPRIEWEPGSNEISLNKEYKWLPLISRFLSVPISEPIFIGKPDNLYPWPWIVSKWNNGHNPSFEQDNEYEELAFDLANFLNELHRIKLINGPLSRRGVPLKNVDEETRKAIGQLEGEIDIPKVIALWDQFLKIPGWDKDFVWVHGDFLPGNILIENNRLSAVIDFSDVGMGDPACDLIIAWSLLKPHSRKIFRENLENVDNDTWERGRGWALSIALIMLPYYKTTNQNLATLARHIIRNILE